MKNFDWSLLERKWTTAGRCEVDACALEDLVAWVSTAEQIGYQRNMAMHTIDSQNSEIESLRAQLKAQEDELNTRRELMGNVDWQLVKSTLDGAIAELNAAQQSPALPDKTEYVPISADMKSVFIDGFGLLPIQYPEQSPAAAQGELIKGEAYQAGLWSMSNAEAMIEDGNFINGKSPAVAVHELKDIEVTDQMASAFNQAICDDAMNDQDLEEVKTGLRAAISHLHPMPKSFYELEIERLVALNDSLLANEIRLIERLRTMQPSPRITEQDAREIYRSINHNAYLAVSFIQWLEDEGRALLDKLNNR